MNYITKKTKVQCIFASVITGIALVTLIMLLTLLTTSGANKTVLSLIYTFSLMVALLCWQGIMSIKIFGEYKAQKQHLCADGIITLVLSVLLFITGLLFGVLQADKALHGSLVQSCDIRIYLTCFLVIMAMWKWLMTGLAMKEHRYNKWLNLSESTTWSLLAISVLISMFVNSFNAIAWIIVSLCWAIVLINISYTLYTYVIKVPTYLETEKAKEVASRNTIDKQLLELRHLYEDYLIDEEEYLDRKEKILNKKFGE